MPKLTPKENYFRIAFGELPEYIPIFTMGMPMMDRTVYRSVTPRRVLNTPDAPRLFDPNPPREWKTIWGVPYVANAEANFGGLPKPGVFILQDITKWDQVIKTPDIDVDNIDWEAMAAADIAEANFDLSQTALQSSCGFGPFQTLMGMMGFTEGLCAMYEEPEAVKELLNFVCEYYEQFIPKVFQYYKPEIWGLGDDTASKYDTFFSLEMYKDLFKPIYVRLAAQANAQGIPSNFHNCGRCEAFIPDMVDFGVRWWDPAQVQNDLLGIKETYKGRFAICGGWELVPPTDRELTEEEVREKVRATIDYMAKDGGYAFSGGVMGNANDQERTQRISSWVRDEAYNYGDNYYEKKAVL